MKTKTNLIFSITVLFALVCLLVVPNLAANAQDAGYRVNLSRNIGYSSGSQVRGDFTISLIGPAEQVASVVFLIDGEPMNAAVQQAPFEYRFKTQAYPDAIHELGAEVTLKDGSVLNLDTRRYQFVSNEEQAEAMQKIIFPLLGGTLLLMIIGMGGQFLTLRNKPATGFPAGYERNYGFAGGSICRHCNRPTPRHVWGLNMVIGKFDRCENCGRWSIMRALPIDMLRAAEAAERVTERESGQMIGEKSEEEKLRELLDRSKYTND